MVEKSTGGKTGMEQQMDPAKACTECLQSWLYSCLQWWVVCYWTKAPERKKECAE